MKIQTQRLIYRLMAIFLAVIVIMPILFKLIICTLELSDFLTGMTVIAALFAAYVINDVVFNNIQQESRKNYRALIDIRKEFWKGMRKEYLDFNFSKKHIENALDVFRLKIVLGVAGLPYGLIDEQGKHTLTNNINDFPLEDKISGIQDSNLKPYQEKLLSFVRYLYLKNSDERKIKEENDDYRSSLGDFYEIICKNNTYNYVKDNFGKDLHLLIILTWLDIAHRQNVNENHKGKVHMYLYTQKLISDRNSEQIKHSN